MAATCANPASRHLVMFVAASYSTVLVTETSQAIVRFPLCSTTSILFLVPGTNSSDVTVYSKVSASVLILFLIALCWVSSSGTSASNGISPDFGTGTDDLICLATVSLVFRALAAFVSESFGKDG